MSRTLLGLTLVLLVWTVAAWVLSYRYVASYAFTVADDRGEFATHLESDAGRLAWTREQTRIVPRKQSVADPADSGWSFVAATDDARAALRLNTYLPADARGWGIVHVTDPRTDLRVVHYHVVALALAVVSLGLLWHVLVTAPPKPAATPVTPVDPPQ